MTDPSSSVKTLRRRSAGLSVAALAFFALMAACVEENAPRGALSTPTEAANAASAGNVGPVLREGSAVLAIDDRDSIMVSSAAALEKAVADAPAGAVIKLASGRYNIADLKIRQSMTLMGDGAPEDTVLHSTAPTQKGILNPVGGVAFRVANLTLSNATSPDKNGAGIRHDGDDLTIVNCIFANNENGVLATGAPTGAITITGAGFNDSGHGDGYSHGIYVVNAASLTITDSRFSDTKIGHHVKSLAAKTHISNTDFRDGVGRASYTLDASKGGDVTFTNNRVTQSAIADNPAIINYDLTRGGDAIALRITNNEIINRHPRGRLLRNKTDLTPIIFGNRVVNQDRGFLDYKQTEASEQASQLRIEERIEDKPPSPATLLKQGPAPKNGKRSGILRAPEFDRTVQGLAHLKLQNNWREDTREDYFTFGQAFAEGALRPGESIATKFGDDQTPAQIDVLATHKDGSVRHGAVTVKAAPLKSGAVREGVLVKHEDAATTDFDAAAILRDTYHLPLSFTFYFGDNTQKDISLDARKAVLEAFATTDGHWLSGPYAKETRAVIDVAPHLQLRFDVRVYRDGDIRTDIVFSNEKTFSPGRRELLYDVKIGDANEPVAAYNRIFHHRSSTWRETLWHGRTPNLHVQHDLQGLIAARAIAPLDTSLGVSAGAIAGNEYELQQTRAPLAPALINKYFPTTGLRADIGLYTQWASHYLAAQTERAKRVMLANADAGGAAPWHAIDEKTGAPVSIEDYPEFWIDERGLKDEHRQDAAHPDFYASSTNDWWPDNAHKPDLFYVPWLVTADRYYADELAMQGAFALFGRWPDLREGRLNAIDIGQVRGTAWSLRDVSNAAWGLPDKHPSKDYLRKVRSESLRLMKEKYIDRRAMRATGELEGYIEEDIGREPERISPWQNDYVAMALWLEAWRGDEDAVALLGWVSNFHAGRLLTPDLPLRYAAAYMFPARGRGDGPVDNWAALSARLMELRDGYGESMEGYPGMAGGYFGSALAALTGIASATQDTRAYEALAMLVHHTGDALMWLPSEDASVAKDNNFLFSLVTPSGKMIYRKNVRKKSKGGPENEFLYGGDGNDEMHADDGDDAVIGFAGDDRLNGGAGADVIVGGAGDDRIIGGPGDDLLSGGAGADVFEYSQTPFGNDTIHDFNPQEDKLALPAAMAASPEAAMMLVTQSPSGAKISPLGAGGAILLRGVDAKTLSVSNFEKNPN